MKHLKVEQNTQAWYDVKAGIPSASGFEKIITPKKLEYSASAAEYIAHLIAERYTGHVIGFQSEAMQEGHRREPESRAAFTLTTGLKVEDGGVFFMDDLRSCASPDGLLGDTGLWEAKNPSDAKHVLYDQSDGQLLVADYRIQLQTQLMHSEREYTYIMSYFPELVDVIVRVNRDEETISKIRAARDRFCDELDTAWEAYKKKHGITESKWEKSQAELIKGRC